MMMPEEDESLHYCHGCGDLLMDHNRGPDELFCDSCVPEQQGIANAFSALYKFCEVEMGWEFFRAEFEIGDSQSATSATLSNARKLREYLGKMKHVPAVREVLEGQR